MLTVAHLSKSFGPKQALTDVSFTANNGRVTGFLGPNGAGKSTTMRSLLGLISPDSGTTLVDGRPFATSASPLTHVGAVLDAKSAHKGRTARAHLLALAQTHGIDAHRVDEVIDFVGLTSVKSRRAGGFSLGMSQRLNIAAALLGDPTNLVLDEPVNGLDPEGVRWIRDLCRYYASVGRTVLLSSHLMSEVALTADDLVIIGQGRILATMTVTDFIEQYSTHAVHVVTPQPAELAAALATLDSASVTSYQVPAESRTGNSAESSHQLVEFRISGVPLEQVANLIANHGVVIYQLSEERTSLEDAYLQLTHSSVEYAPEYAQGAALGAAAGQSQPLPGEQVNR
jgi:ABC-2 type transport system ATP-binding protein